MNTQNNMYTNNSYFTQTGACYTTNNATSPITTSMTQHQQQVFSQVFPNSSNTSSPSLMMDDWFNPSLKPECFQDILQLLPISPPLTASPVSETNDVVSAEALVALFPDILNNTAPPPASVLVAAPAPTVQVPRRLAVKPIMPKTAIPIAPRPAGDFVANPPIMKRKMEDSDEVAQKRQKNTDAARRSRLKKIIKMESLEKQVTELESDNSRLTTRVAVLESEKGALIAKDKGLEDRIRVLEAQLAEAHRALTSKSS